MEGSSNVVRRTPVVLPFRIQNPFVFKVGQVFTGFGIGCGIGIGVGRPLNLRAIPLVSDVMAATGGATYAFSGIGKQANRILRKLGAKNVQAGIGCGIGFGHGFGVGLALKPGVVNQVRLYLTEALGKVMAKLGKSTGMAIDQTGPPWLTQKTLTKPSNKRGDGSTSELAGEVSDAGQGKKNGVLHHSSITFGSQSQKVLDEFLQNPDLKEKGNVLHELVSGLESGNDLLKLVLKHHLRIEELIEENKKLRDILVNDLKVPVNNMRAYYSNEGESLCANCFECRRKMRNRHA